MVYHSGYLPGDYDTLKDIVFVLLGEEEPVLAQVFEQNAKEMRFVRGIK